ncbi:MAG: acyl-phosphate--glycerol-3-phosphate O-acyltransferase, partial [Planctomycetes bacterium]|nr:acyl-phosphate--glycerol-3-phosphate O-acyltransferase [Planctomycetota bacterium]
MEWAWIAGVGLAAYLLGSVPFGLLTGFLVRGVDIR